MDVCELKTAAKYGFCGEFGYLIYFDREIELPEEFSQWKEIAENVTQHIEDGSIRALVDQLPMLDYRKLETRNQKIFARTMASYIVSGYVRTGSSDIIDAAGNTKGKVFVPKQIAIPYYELSRDLGVKPLLDYNDLCTIDVKMTKSFDINCDQEEALQYMDVRYVIPGKSANMFMKTSSLVEFRVANLLRLLPKLISGNVDDVTEALERVVEILERVRDVYSMITKYVDADQFFTKMLPFMGGYGGEGTPYPDGMVFEGVDAEPQKLLPPSAAQSMFFHILDELLGVEHDTKNQAHVDNMRECLYPEQRLLIHDLRKLCIKEFILREGNDRTRKVYEQCLNVMQMCRASHIKAVTKLVIQPAKKASGGKTVDDIQMLQHPTGQSLGKYLSEMRQDNVNLQKVVKDGNE